jgi:hypothetical protein
MAEVKIAADSGGGSVALKGPASTTGNAAVSLKLPVADGSSGQYLKTDGSGQLSFNPGKPNILEQFYHPCDGSTIATSGGNVTLPNVTAAYTPTTSYTTTTGSEISYVPPTGTTIVIYKFNYLYSIVDDHNITHNKFFIDSDEVTYQRYTMSGHIHLATPVTVEIGIPIGGTANTNTGRQASWSSAKTLKLTSRVYGSAQEAKHHATFYWDGTTGSHFRIPSIGITAIG